MDRRQYLAELSRALRRLPRKEYEAAMEYYREYFDEAGPEMEQQVIKDLGTPAEAAGQIIRETARRRVNEPVGSVKKGFSSLWMIILGLFAVPIALPLTLALLAVLLSAVVSVFCVWLCGFIMALVSVAGGVAVAICGGIVTAAHPATGVVNIGLGILFIGLGLLALQLALWIGGFLLLLVRKLFSWVLRRRKA